MNGDLTVLQDNARRGSSLLKAMSNEHRLMILCQLLRGEVNVGQLERIVGLSQSALSQHLARLRKDALVKTRREAQTIYYSLNGPEAEAVLQALYTLYCGATKDDPAALATPPQAPAAADPAKPAPRCPDETSQRVHA